MLRRPLLGVLVAIAAQGVQPITQVAHAEEPVAAQAVAQVESALNINTASAEELAAGLKGVGGSKADAIVRYREQFGPFESVEELTEVKGIGIATVERNRERIRLQ